MTSQGHEKWKLYDLGRAHHRPAGLEDVQPRYFIARDVDHPDADHRYLFEVAMRVRDWRNEFEDLLLGVVNGHLRRDGRH